MEKEFNMDDYEEVEITVGELEETDLVMDSLGRWRKISAILPTHFPTRMFKISFTNGYVECSGSHQWTIYDESLNAYLRNAEELFSYPEIYAGFKCGGENGPSIISIEEIEPKLSRCVALDNDDHLFSIGVNKSSLDPSTKRFEVASSDGEKSFKLFEEFEAGDTALVSGEKIEILGMDDNIWHSSISGSEFFLSSEEFYSEMLSLESDQVLTHNCQFRLVCGRLGTIPSMMATGSTIATTIKGDIPGAGALVSNGKVDMLQHYFAKIQWIRDWFADRGLNEFGKLEGAESDGIDPNDLETLEGEEEIGSLHDEISIEFGGVSGRVDKTPDQEYREV